MPGSQRVLIPAGGRLTVGVDGVGIGSGDVGVAEVHPSSVYVPQSSRSHIPSSNPAEYSIATSPPSSSYSGPGVTSLGRLGGAFPILIPQTSSTNASTKSGCAGIVTEALPNRAGLELELVGPW